MVRNIGNCLEEKLALGFRIYGDFVGRRPLPFLLIPILITAAMLPGFMYTKLDFDILGLFNPKTAISHQEWADRRTFDDLDFNTPFPTKYIDSARLKKSACEDIECQNPDSTNSQVSKPLVRCGRDYLHRVYAMRVDGGNILTPASMKSLNKIAIEFRHNFSYPFKGKSYRYLRDFCAVCEQDCRDLNEWIPRAQILLFENQRNPNVRLTYPVMNVYKRALDVGKLIYGVNTEGHERHIKGAKVAAMYFESRFDLKDFKAASSFGIKFRDFWLERSGKNGLEFIPSSSEDYDRETFQIVKITLPNVLVTGFVLITFMILSNISKNPIRSKPLEAFMAIVSVVLALATTFGLMFYCGAAFNPVATVSPFLILAIGVDDAFLILGAWRVSNPKLAPHRRLGITMSESGASITVTTLTDGLCFGLGAILSGTPAVSNFCLFTAVAVAVDYVYQISFFAAIVAYGGRREADGKPGCLCMAVQEKSYADICVMEEVVETEKTFCGKTFDEKLTEEPTGRGTLMHKLLRKYYAPLICKTEVRWLTLFVYVLYFLLCMHGCCTIRVNMSPNKFVLDYSHLNRLFEISDQYLWSDNVEPYVLILRPPDFRIPANLKRFLDFVTELERAKYSSGSDSTSLWLREYLIFLSDFFEADLFRDFYNKTYLGEFFLQDYAHQFRDSVKFQYSTDSSDQSFLSAFQFKTSFFRVDNWEKRSELVQMWRKLCRKYSDFHPTVTHSMHNSFVDSQEQIAPNAMQTIGCAVMAMTFIAAVFIPHKLSMYYVSLSLFSISLGVIGGLSLWGCDLDQISLACILMAIGFAVDFSAHICYRYHRLGDLDPREKVVDTIGHVGWPIIQATLSTFLGVFVLAFVPAYMVRIFFKSSMLVLPCGLIHALLFLPVLQITWDQSGKGANRNRN